MRNPTTVPTAEPMLQPVKPKPERKYRESTKMRILGASVIVGLALLTILIVTQVISPRFDVVRHMTLPVRVHAASAIFALLLGGMIFVLPKGRTLHITMGSLWVASMIAVSISALFIKQIFTGHFSPIHLFVPLTAYGLYKGLTALMRGEGKRHGRRMTSLFLGALMLAGALTFLPGRSMWQMFFG